MAYTVADIIKATGAKRRTVQFWADKGIIRPTRATQEGGHGVHRSFTRDELIIACLIHPVSLGWRGDQTRSLGEMKELATALRHLLKQSVTRDDFDDATAGKGQFYFDSHVDFWGRHRNRGRKCTNERQAYLSGRVGTPERHFRPR